MIDRAEYLRAWRAANPENVAASIARSSERRKQKWGEFLFRERERYAGNADAICVAQKASRDANPDRRKAVVKKSYAANKHKFISRCAGRRAMKLAATPVWVDMGAIGDIYFHARKLSEETGVPHEVDHIVPLKGKGVCGLHVPWNLQVIPMVENRRKGAKYASS